MNLKTRLRNKAFVVSLISFIVLMTKTFIKYEFPENFELIINTFLSLLTMLGILIDPTTPGISDEEVMFHMPKIHN
ncbi:MAG: phage holin [Clostridiaceae bacterium]